MFISSTYLVLELIAIKFSFFDFFFLKVADDPSSNEVDFSTYAPSNCNNADITYLSAESAAAVKEENEKNKIVVGMNPLHERGKFVSPLNRHKVSDKKLVLFVDSQFLNEAVKDVSNVVEIIVNNKRCIVSLNNLNNDKVIDERSCKNEM
uniref:Uncharacterized protein n=1 Tax=Rhodnius prolixus TaxID=13249 RepID=T1HEC0_RHOPR